MRPEERAKAVCHSEQLRIWSDELADTLNLNDLLKEDMSYDDVIILKAVLTPEIEKLVLSAFNLFAETYPEYGAHNG